MRDRFVSAVSAVCLVIVVACAAFTCLTLSGCGGGDDDEDATSSRQTNHPVNCNERNCK